MIRVLIAEDSPVAREMLAHILNSDPEITVVGAVCNGEEVIEEINRNKPDIVTMDVHMPKMDGFKATRIIMETNPVPIIIVTGSSDMQELELSFHAVEAGAVAVIQKPQGIGHPSYPQSAAELVKMVKLMAEVKVVRRWTRFAERKTLAPIEALNGISSHSSKIRVVAIGASTGGPPILQYILSELPKDFPVPVLIVQHMAKGFTQGFAEWLGETSALPVHVAFHGSLLRPGHVYVAPDGFQMKVERNERLSCQGNEPENGLCPSVSILFRSVAEVFGKSAVGILLTGMGKDGAEELKLIKEKGAITIAQDQESCIVFGMPGEAVKLNAAKYVLAPEKIVATLKSMRELI